MSDNRPLVTIGVPVYNGGEELLRALQSLLDQDYRPVEIVISDNASTDDTADVCRELVQAHPHVHYHRNAENIGAIGNFVKLLQWAGGTYFVWAAHDDVWTHDYISRLVACLEEHPDAVLATPFTRHVHADGTPSRHRNDHPAPGTGCLDNIRVFLRDDACTWIYGVFRSQWLRQHGPQWLDYPTWRGDLTWLFETLLRFPVVGTDRAVIYKKVTDGSYRPRTARDRMAGWSRVFRDLTEVCLQHERGWRRCVALAHAWFYCYRRYVRSGNPIGTLIRVLRILTMWLYFRTRYGPLVERTQEDQAPRTVTSDSDDEPQFCGRAA